MEVEVKLSKPVKTRSGGETATFTLKHESLTTGVVLRAFQIIEQNKLGGDDQTKASIMAAELADISLKTLQEMPFFDTVKLIEGLGQIMGESQSRPISESA
jgi:hypothetical protein